MDNNEINKTISAELGQPPTDFCLDLNKVFLAEVTLLDARQPQTKSTEARRGFRDELVKIIGCGWYQSGCLLQANAKQRAEALAKFIIKRKQEK